MHRLILAVAFMAAAPIPGWAQNDDPFPPHQVMDNLFLWAPQVWARF